MARHDHRQSFWAVAGGSMLWCYRCGAIRFMRGHSGLPSSKWIKTTGPRGDNPASVAFELAMKKRGEK